jgi:ABC-type ATPase with predicted acetyltransferase domain
MVQFEVESVCAPLAAMGPHARELMRFFGITTDRLRQRTIRHRLSLTLEPGQICTVTGPSGAGKSILLRAMYAQMPPNQRHWLGSDTLPTEQTVIDCFDAPLHDTLPLLSRAGLSDAWSLLQPPATLSDGQQWRFRLAQALLGDKPVVFADEFCAALDTTTAMGVAWRLHRTARQTGRIFVLASNRDDILGELCPDVIVRVTDRDIHMSRPHTEGEK